MKVKVTVEAQIDTERIPSCNTNVRNAIEKAAFNKEKDPIAEGWALQEVENQCSRKWVSIELREGCKEGWNQPTNLQAEDRLHRIGQNRGVQIILPVVKESIDALLDEIPLLPPYLNNRKGGEYGKCKG